MVKFVNFGNMSVREQLRTALQASAIAGVHGQGLVWTSMLSASSTRGCALLELMPKAMAKVNSHSKYDYYRWTKLNECAYKSVIFPDDNKCDGKYFRICGNINVTREEGLPTLMRALKQVQEHVTLRRRLPTVDLT